MGVSAGGGASRVNRRNETDYPNVMKKRNDK